MKDKNVIFVVNKTDLSDEKDVRADVYISAASGENVEELKKMLYERFVGKVDTNADYLCEERHLAALSSARDKISSALSVLGKEPLDILAIDVRAAWQSLGEITGKTATEEIINNIFSKFCVGK